LKTKANLVAGLQMMECSLRPQDLLIIRKRFLGHRVALKIWRQL